MRLPLPRGRAGVGLELVDFEWSLKLEKKAAA